MKVEINATPVDAKDDDCKEMDQWEIDSKIRTLMEAETIKADPELMKVLQPHIEKMKEAANKITTLSQLKAVAKQKLSEPDPE